MELVPAIGLSSLTLTPGRALDLLLVVGFGVVTYLRPRWTPYLAVIGVVAQSTLPRASTSDGEILLGIFLGLLVHRARSGGWPTLRSSPLGAWLLLGLALLTLASYAANRGAEQGPEALQGTEFFVSRTLLVVGIALLGGITWQDRYRWLHAVAVAAVVLALYRLVEIVGVPLHPATAALGMSVIGDLGDVGSWNLFATFMAVGFAAALADAGIAGVPSRRSLVGVAMALVILVAMASAGSRTVVGIFLAVLLILALADRSVGRRVLLAVLGVVFAVSSLSPITTLTHKTVLVQRTQISAAAIDVAAPGVFISSSPDAVGGVPPGPNRPPRMPIASRPLPPPLQPDWRTVLDRSAYRLEQSIPAVRSDPTGDYLAFVAGHGGGATGIKLVVDVNGKTVATLIPDQISAQFRWVLVEIPPNVVRDGAPVTVEMHVTGQPNSQRDYFLIGGLYARSSVATSRIWTGHNWLTDDLSSDPGIQQGTNMVFFDGQIPPLQQIKPPDQQVIDPSIHDRLQLWDTAARVFARHPVFGTGFYTFGIVQDSYARAADAFSPYANTHSNYLQLLSDLGLLGPLLVLSLLAVATWLVARRRIVEGTADWADMALVSVLLAFAVSSATQTWLADSRVYLLCWLMAVLATSVQPVGVLRAIAAGDGRWLRRRWPPGLRGRATPSPPPQDGSRRQPVRP